jgi:hypothetical protein
VKCDWFREVWQMAFASLVGRQGALLASIQLDKAYPL